MLSYSETITDSSQQFADWVHVKSVFSIWQYCHWLPRVKLIAKNIFCKLMRMSYFPVNFEPLRNHIINFSMRLYKNIYLIGQQCCTMMTASGWSSTVVSTSQETVLFFMLFYQRIWILNVLSKFIHVSNDIKMIIITRFDFTYFDHWLNLSAASTCGQ